MTLARTGSEVGAAHLGEHQCQRVGGVPVEEIATCVIICCRHLERSFLKRSVRH